jgi:hypothetical protein
LEQFAPKLMDGHMRANRQKPSGIAAKALILRVHLVPALGSNRLDAITNEDVQRLKMRLEKKAAKTLNNVLTVLSVLLKKAVEWGVIERMPCSIELLPVPKPVAGPRRHTQRWAIAVRADDEAARRRASDASASPRTTRAVSGQR